MSQNVFVVTYFTKSLDGASLALMYVSNNIWYSRLSENFLCLNVIAHVSSAV